MSWKEELPGRIKGRKPRLKPKSPCRHHQTHFLQSSKRSCEGTADDEQQHSSTENWRTQRSQVLQGSEKGLADYSHPSRDFAFSTWSADFGTKSSPVFQSTTGREQGSVAHKLRGSASS